MLSLIHTEVAAHSVGAAGERLEVSEPIEARNNTGGQEQRAVAGERLEHWRGMGSRSAPLRGRVTEKGKPLPRARTPSGVCTPWGQGGGGLAGAALGGLAVSQKPPRQGSSRRPCSQRLTGKAAFAFLTPGFGEGDVKGLEAEGPGLGHFGGLGRRDGSGVAEWGAEAGGRAVMRCGEGGRAASEPGGHGDGEPAPPHPARGLVPQLGPQTVWARSSEFWKLRLQQPRILSRTGLHSGPSCVQV